MLKFHRLLLVICFSIVIISNSVFGQNAPIYPGSVYDSLDAPNAITTGDFNGDTIPDIVTSNTDLNLVSLFGDGFGKFTTGITTYFGIAANSLTTGDFNADGFLDLAATTGGFSTDVHVVFGDGLGAFSLPTILTAGASANAIASADVNNNGALDLAVANVNSNDISIFLGTGAGAFGAATNFAAGSQPKSLVIAHLNGDANLDIAAGGFSGTVAVLIGTGTGSFGAATLFSSISFGETISAGDVNNDSKQDLAFQSLLSASNISVILGNGTGGFGAPSAFATGGIFASGIEIVDLTSDGNRDVAACFLIPNELNILAGNGAGGFAANQPKIIGTGPNGFITSDVNVDGARDVVVGVGGPQGISVLLADGSGSFDAPTRSAAGDAPSAIASADFNNDVKADLAVANSASNNISILIGTGSSAFGAATNFNVGTQPSGVAAGTVNGDSNIDLVVSNQGSNNISVLLGTGAGTFGAATSHAAGTAPAAIVLVDMNNNGANDAVTANSGSNNVSVLLGNGTGGFGAAANTAVGTTPRGLARGDLNANGATDICTANGGSDNASVLLGNGAGGFSSTSSQAAGTAPAAVALADLNNDASLDLIVGNETSSDIYVYIGNGAGGFAAPTIYAAGTAPVSIKTGDLDGDGKIDVLVANRDAATTYLYLGDNTGALAAPLRYVNAGRGSGIVTGDWNGDARVDFAASCNNTDNVSIHRNLVVPPVITTHPSSQSICLGGGVVFSVVATNATSYQWRRNAVNLVNGGAISGATTTSLTISTTVPGDAGNYDVVVTNSNGSSTSNAAVLTLVSPVSISVHPAAQSTCAGNMLTLTVTAANVTSYQWRKNTVNIGGATSSSLTFNPIVVGDAATYDVVCGNLCGSVTSNSAAVSVFPSAPAITLQPASQNICAGGPVTFNVTANNAVSFQWRKNTVNIGGATNSSYTDVNVQAGDAGNYDCVVTNPCGSTTSLAATLGVSTGVPVITLNPSSQSICAGSGVTFNAAATGALSFQWRKNTINIGGATAASYSIVSVVTGDAGAYDCVITNVCGSATTASATLTVSNGVPSITLQPLSQSICAGSGVTFTVAATGAQTFQWRKNAINIGGATASSFNIGSTVTGDAGVYDCIVSNACGPTGSAGATLTMSNGVPSITLHPSSQSICAGSGVTFNVAATGAQTFQWRKNAINIGGATAASYSIVSVVTGDAGAYDCVITNACGNSTSAAANLTVSNGVPSITLHPSSQSICAGSGVTFNVAATGAQTFQWRKNAINIGGATAASYSIVSVVTGDAGAYDCVITNACGNSTSAAANLTVSNGVPTITLHPSSQSICAGSGVTFNVAATGAQTFQWRKNAINIGGATAASFSIVSVVTGDAGAYDCVITNACGNSTSGAANLTVSNGVPNITLHPSSQSICAGSGVTFNVAATGAQSFQWRKDAINIGGATAASFSIVSVVTGDAGAYDCVITNACGNSTSGAANLTVSDGVPNITLHPVASSVCAGDGVLFSVAATGASTYQWRKDTINISGANATTYAIGSAALADAGSYDCVITNVCGPVTSGAASLNVSNGVPVVTTHPQSTLQCEGGSVTFTVVGTGATSYQWRKGGVDISGETASSLILTAVTPSDAGSYDVVLTNPCGSTPSGAAILTITNVLYVNSAAAGANTGLSWADAYNDLQSALQSPCTNIQIWVAAGTYRPDLGTGNRSLTFQLVNNKAVFGGFSGTETMLSERLPESNITILSGDIGVAANAIDNSFHVVTGSGTGATAVLDGMIISSGTNESGNGAGVFVVSGGPRIINCTITNNSAIDGAGAHADGGTTVFDGCRFVSNVASGLGGGVRAVSGGAIIKNSTFSQNVAVSGGGAAVSGGAVIANCSFLANQASSLGGGVLTTTTAGANCINVTLSGNTAANGAGMHISANATVSNATMANNTASASGGGIRAAAAVTLSNSILWNNNDVAGQTQASQIVIAGGSAAMNYCIVQGLTGSLGGSGNLSIDPKLVSARGADLIAGTADDDLRLTAFSPCVDAGNNSLVTADLADLDNDLNIIESTPLDPAQQPRFFNDTLVADTGLGTAPLVDIGADEYNDDDPLPFGTGTFGCNGMQTMGTSGPPKLNNPGFYLTCDLAPQFSFGLGIVTDSPDLPGTDIFGIGVILHTDLIFATELLSFDFVSDGLGNGFAPAPIPNIPELVGKYFYADALWVWSTCTLAPPYNASTSRGLKIKILPE
ncbi:MAG: immunoglobulin domain-containing protein [Planctomycetota bacterium]